MRTESVTGNLDAHALICHYPPLIWGTVCRLRGDEYGSSRGFHTLSIGAPLQRRRVRLVLTGLKWG